jgi:serine/threonine protein kinase/tetratricopeptide (TPR) repeat protein
MDARCPDDFKRLSPTQACRVDAVCRGFEAELRDEHAPRIEDFVVQADPPQRVALLRELIAVEVELRRDRGERPDPGEYCARFPDHHSRIAAVFQPERVTSFDGASNPTDLSATPPPSEVSFSPVGPYKLLRQIGEGGMGVVYLAEQESPIRRRVALKIIRPGLDSDQVIARFEAERQALAMMDHPHIAKVFDAGTTETGQHYFVMELVHGIPITEFCDQNRLAPAERLELFIRVCQAVQHAHQKGIIHRDIKPSNVLIGLHDGRPVPKVIDFGLAKAVDQRLTERTMYTQFGQVVGTLEYMSPEQAELGVLDIDTRSDIYSLGVVLYELLTGSTPLRRARLPRAAYADVLQRIREEEAPKPSSRLSELGPELATIAQRRQTEPARLAKLVRGELDWIVMRALEKDRTRRYETADGLARDVERFLSHEPVEAGPPSATYRLRKYARKHRGVLAMAGTFAGLLMLAAAVTTRQAYLATMARNEAQNAYEQSRINEAKAKEQESEARRSAAESERVLNFFENRVLAAARPEGCAGGLGRAVTLRQAIDAALPAVAQDFAAQPLVEARLRQTLGTSYYHLGDPARAAEQYEASRVLYARHRGKDDPDTLKSIDNLASSYNAVGRQAHALKLHEQALALMKAKLGPDHLNTLQTMNNLATSYYSLGRHTQALTIQEETLSLRKSKLGPDHPDTLASMSNLAASYYSLGRHAEALKLFEATLALQRAKLGPDHADTLVSMNNLAASYYNLGRHVEALKLHEETLTLRKSKLGPDHPDTLASLHNLANSYQAVGRRAEALQLHEQTLAFMTAKLGADHPDTLSSIHNVANSYAALGRHAEAIKFYEEALTQRKAKLGPDHPDTLTSMNYLANSYGALGRQHEALRLRQDTLALRKSKLGPDHHDTLASMHNLAISYEALGLHAEALQVRQDTLALQNAKLGPDHPDTLTNMYNLANSYAALGRQREALRLKEETLALRKAKLGTDHPDTLLSRLSVASGLTELGRGAEAAADCLSAAEAWEKLVTSDGNSMYNAACFRAVSAAALRAADQSPSARRQADAESDRALAWLERAIAAGFRDAAAMAEDHDLDALRHRADFKELLARLRTARPK